MRTDARLSRRCRGTYLRRAPAVEAAGFDESVRGILTTGRTLAHILPSRNQRYGRDEDMAAVLAAPARLRSPCRAPRPQRPCRSRYDPQRYRPDQRIAQQGRYARPAGRRSIEALLRTAVEHQSLIVAAMVYAGIALLSPQRASSFRDVPPAYIAGFAALADYRA